MDCKRLLTTAAALVLVWMSASPIPVSAVAPTLNKNQVIAADEVAPNGITADQINQFLVQAGSQLANYTIPEEYEVYYPIGQGQWDKVVVRQEWQPDGAELEIYHGKTVAQLLVEWSTTNRSTRNPSSPGNMNPLIPLATMDKESASVISSYRTNIVSERFITMSWLMGYGFNGTMADCVANGNCDVDYNRQRALWYGGPGQQIVEGTAALKRWSTNPTLLNSCTDRWQDMRVMGECLSLENGISYALYRYTPTFSGNQLFLTRYDSIKNTFGNIAPYPEPSTDETANDVSSYSLTTYANKVSLTGAKAVGVRAFFRNEQIAGPDEHTYNLSYEPSIGNIEDAIEFRRADGGVINRKPIVIKRHKTGDANGDGTIDLQDLSLLATYWGHTDPQNSMVNLNPDTDSTVDIVDLSLLAANWNG